MDIATPAPAITHNNSGYYVVGTTVTLNAEGYTMSGGFTVKDAQNNDVPLSGGNKIIHQTFKNVHLSLTSDPP